MTPLGVGAQTYWERSKKGCSGIRHIENFDPSNLPVTIAGEVPGFAAKEFMDPKVARRMDRFAQFAVAAAREAIEQAKLEITDENRENIGVVVNTGGGGIPMIEHEVGMMHDK